MGKQASVILYPTDGTPPSATDLHGKIREILYALERANVVAVGVPADSEVDDELTFVTEALQPQQNDEEPEHRWAHVYIEPTKLGPAISELVYTATEELWSEESSPSLKDALAVPLLDITVLDRPLTVVDDVGEEISTWALVEFSYEDARLNSEEIHTIRNDYHAVFHELKRVLGAEIAWSVVPG